MINKVLSDEELILAAQLKVREFFNSDRDKALPFHHLTHTQKVVEHCTDIAGNLPLDEKDQAILLIAAWFTDTGYLNSEGQDPEERSAEKVSVFLKSHDTDAEFIINVRDCILATRFPGKPQSLREMILNDAVYFYFGEDEIKASNKLLRKEHQLISGIKIKKPEWRSMMISKLTAHHYFTDYAKKLLEEKKQLNISLLMSKEEDDEGGTQPQIIPVQTVSETKTEEVQSEVMDTGGRKKTAMKDGPGRGVETMFRISSGNNQRLSDMADNKANIMITISSIIFSVVLSMLLQKLGDNMHLIIPTIILLAVCVSTMVFSILATRPALPKGIFSKEDLEGKKVNLLFFGNFYKMDYAEYQQGMNMMMRDNEFLYGSLTRDVYSQGVVLGKKYRLLRVAYNVFMFGIILSVLAFALSVLSIL